MSAPQITPLKSVIPIFSTLLSVVVMGCNGRSGSNGASGSASSREELLEGIITSKPPDTPESLAAKQAKLEANLELAQAAAAQKDFDQSIALLEESVVLDPHNREVLITLVRHSQLRSRSLVNEDPARSYRLMVQASGYLRMLQEAHKEFTKEEQAMFADVLFDEACAHARSNRREEFTGALNAAIGAGFADLERLKSEPDLMQFREVPELQSLFRQAAETVSARQSGSP